MILRELRIKSRPRKVPNIIEVVQMPPPHSWFKINIDGSAFDTLGLSGCSRMFRTYHDFVCGCFSIPLGIGYAFETELATVIHAINFAWKYGWKRLWLENDSIYVVSILLSHSVKVSFYRDQLGLRSWGTLLICISS
ncbi:Ribonuclease H-like domain containing protein [Parasponia andersonii]|uniref:Ribonuclease H-like domain containing protein n=1 Tax=Parasponia andersonii TaxID=3476 RepID=A0A2P5CSC3_PARAD|nr:Ribonuclease H-like domain containing protein [Parasponia andersonii]